MTPYPAARRANRAARPAGSRHEGPADADEQQLADTLVRMWSLASGRRLRPGVRPCELSEDELIAFWADDFTAPCGRHAAPGPLCAEAAA